MWEIYGLFMRKTPYNDNLMLCNEKGAGKNKSFQLLWRKDRDDVSRVMCRPRPVSVIYLNRAVARRFQQPTPRQWTSSP